MKFTSMIVGAFAALATAAPVEERSLGGSAFISGNILGSQFGGGFDVLGGINNFAFKDQNFAYLAKGNGFDQNLFASVVLNQGLAVDNIANLFINDFGGQFGLQQLLGLNSLFVADWFIRNNLVAGVQFNAVQLPILQLGVFGSAFSQFDNSFGVDLSGFGNDINNFLGFGGKGFGF